MDTEVHASTRITRMFIRDHGCLTEAPWLPCALPSFPSILQGNYRESERTKRESGQGIGEDQEGIGIDRRLR
jgi:hypothetical protein